MTYVGRFAPSPTGPLHFGSLVAAVASYLEAKTQHGKWIVRMEDVDIPRVQVGAADGILNTLDTFGFEWDGDIVYQSQRNEAYMNAFNILKDQQLIYPCTCTRKEIADSASSIGIEGIVYAGTCLIHATKPNAPMAWRIKTEDKLIQFKDAIQGSVSQHLKFDIGDFVLKRADGLFTYQLAVVVDDAEQRITHVVRGADLLNSTPRQIYLQNLLAMNTPNYAHVPVACNSAGEKLSKQTLAQPLNAKNASLELFEALHFLGQDPPAEIKNATLDEMWRWAKENWMLNNAIETK
jgi:glutamyl-Q tRNA(Asp) synthetase